MNNDNKNRGEKTPSAWLVTGGRMFKDRAFISEAGARAIAQERGDGASVEPLHLDDQLPPAPVAEEMEEMECTTCHNDGLNCNVCGYDPDASAQPAVPDVDALAQHIRKVDGNNDMGAGALAESICNWIEEQ